MNQLQLKLSSLVPPSPTLIISELTSDGNSLGNKELGGNLFYIPKKLQTKEFEVTEQYKVSQNHGSLLDFLLFFERFYQDDTARCFYV